MTDLNKVSFVQQDTANPALTSSASLVSKEKTETQGVADLFNKDVLHAPQKQPVKEEQVSLWSRVMQWFFGPQKVETPTSATTTELTTVDKVAPTKTQSIDSVPVIEAPTSVETTHTQKVMEGKVPFTFRTQDDNLRNLTMEQLFIALVKASIKIQEEKGLVATANFEKFQAIARVTREKLQKALDEMKANERWSSFFSAGQTIAGWTSILATATILISKGILATGILATAGLATPAIMAAVGTAAALGNSGALAALGATTAITTGGKALFDKKKNDHAADKEKRDLEVDVISDASNDQAQRMKDALDTVASLQGLLVQIERRKHQMKQLILR